MQAKVINGNLNVRKSPSTNSKIIDIIANGTVIEVDTEEKGWCAYQNGYVMAEYLVFLAPPAPEDTKAKETKPTAKKTSAKTTTKKSTAKKTTTKKQTAEK